MGDNGAYKISIQTDDGTANHLPSGTKLAEATGAPGQGNFGGTNRKTVFSTSPLLQKDRIYHVVWENTSSDPANNYFSVNEIWTFNKLFPRQPILSDSDYACLYNSGSGWQIQSNNTADMDLGYADGIHDGVSYLQAFYDSGQEIVARISGARMARELFTVSGGNKTISKISVRIAHVSGNSNLNLKIVDSAGNSVLTGSINNNLITVRNWSN